MKKLNIAKLLKDCPKGMELDCTMFEGIEFDSIVDNEYFPIRCRIKNSNDKYNFYSFTKRGYWNNDYKAKCVIFPKGKTTWEGFVPPCKFKVGDRIKHKNSDIYCTLEEYSEGISAYRTNLGLPLTCKDLEQWELVPNKFDINTLVPFESKVLIRNNETQKWIPAFWGYKPKYKYVTTFGVCNYCIPYEGNENLLSTNNDCDDFYKTWEE